MNIRVFLEVILFYSLLGLSLFHAAQAACHFSKKSSESAISERKLFSKVRISGSGFSEAKLLKRTCFNITTIDIFGKIFDEGCKQKTFLVVYLYSEKEEIRMFAYTRYIKSESLHKACYKIPMAGEYEIKVYVHFFDVYKILSFKQNPRIFNSFAKNFLVAKSKIYVKKAKRMLDRNKLPPCNFKLLAASNNFGFWKSNDWNPHVCKTHNILPSKIKSCLHGKRILILGDSQMRGTFAELVNFLKFKSRLKYMKTFYGLKEHAAKIFSFGKKYKAMDVVHGAANKIFSNNIYYDDNDARKNIIITKTNFGSAGTVTFYGSFWNGFGKLKQRRHTSRDDGIGVNEDDDVADIDLTYAVHLNASSEAVDSWMVADHQPTNDRNTFIDDYHIFHDNRIRTDIPFDYVFVCTGLHDVVHFNNTAEFGIALRKVFIPSLLKLVRKPSDICWVSMWAAQEAKKPKKYLPSSNNVRGFAFNDKAKTVLREAGITNWIESRYMTMPRDDLCSDSTHYSWPVTLATIDLWLGTLCSAHNDAKSA